MILFLTLIILMVIGVPIAASIGLSTLFYILLNDIPLIVIVQRMFTGTDSIVLVAIPAFIVAGAVMEVGGLASRLARAADALVGYLTGGFSMVTIVTAMFFAAISGSNVATTAAVGGIMIPEMKQRGYDKPYAAAVAAAGGVMGVIIPPSLSMIIYSSITGTSLAALFMAGFPVGILMAMFMLVVCYVLAKKNGYVGRTEHYSKAQILKAIKDALWALGAPVLMVGGIFSGVFTPTEAAVVAILYGIVVSIFIYKEIKVKDLYKIFLNGIVTSSKIMFIMANAAVLGWVMAAEQIPQQVFTMMTAISSDPIILMLIINIILLIAGCFMETGALLIIITPILMPIALGMGWNPVHFGLVMILNLAIGNLTPPLGVCLYTGAMVAKCRVEDVSKKAIPFLITLLIVLILVSYIPEITMFLPKMLMPQYL
jgi:C4-dicarboxylate transporter DctM subunit